MRKVRGFTVLELMVAVVILSIVVSVAMAGYQGYRDRAAMLVDETRQKILHAAALLYAYDNNVFPASLSDLRDQDLGRAYAQVAEGRKPHTFFVYLKELLGGPRAYAQERLLRLPPRYFNNDLRVLSCPVDRTPPASFDDRERRSYEIDAGARGATPAWLLAHPDAVFIFECNDEGTATELRHRGRALSVITFADGGHGRRDEEGNDFRGSTHGGGGDAAKDKKDDKIKDEDEEGDDNP